MGAQGIVRQPARLLARALALSLMVQWISGCIYMQPPNRAFRTPVLSIPQAPEDGYRHTHRGDPDLVSDSRLGVYVVLGDSNYFHDGRRYFRSHRGRWQRSTRVDGDWISVSIGDVPRGLIARSTRSRSKHHSLPAKHDY